MRAPYIHKNESKIRQKIARHMAKFCLKFVLITYMLLLYYSTKNKWIYSRNTERRIHQIHVQNRHFCPIFDSFFCECTIYILCYCKWIREQKYWRNRVSQIHCNSCLCCRTWNYLSWSSFCYLHFNEQTKQKWDKMDKKFYHRRCSAYFNWKWI